MCHGIKIRYIQTITNSYNFIEFLKNKIRINILRNKVIFTEFKNITK